MTHIICKKSPYIANEREFRCDWCIQPNMVMTNGGKFVMIFSLFIRRLVNRFLVLHISSRYTTKFQIILQWNSHHSRFIIFSCHIFCTLFKISYRRRTYDYELVWTFYPSCNRSSIFYHLVVYMIRLPSLVMRYRGGQWNMGGYLHYSIWFCIKGNFLA